MLAGDPVGKRRITEQVRDALETIGFFTIVGHGVPEAVVRDARDLAYEFFAPAVGGEDAHPAAQQGRDQGLRPAGKPEACGHARQ